MNINTKVFQRIIEETRVAAINQMVALMGQTGRFAHLDIVAMRDLAERAWRGEVDLDKEMT